MRSSYIRLPVIAWFAVFPSVLSQILHQRATSAQDDAPSNTTKVILITATRDRPQRAADFNMLVQTIRHLENVFWIVVEGDAEKNLYMKQLLVRSKVPHVYLDRPDTELCNGWALHNEALDYIRRNDDLFPDDSVVYFAGDEDSFDLRLFEEYVRNVKEIGVWAAGSGYVSAESPMVLHGKVIGWNVAWRPKRKFALTFHSFALKTGLIKKSRAAFDMRCAGKAPEDCFLRQLDINQSSIVPFGHEGTSKNIFVYHRRVDNKGFFNELPSAGFFVDYESIETPKCMMVRVKFPDIAASHAQDIANRNLGSNASVFDVGKNAKSLTRTADIHKNVLKRTKSTNSLIISTHHWRRRRIASIGILEEV
ncbi:unnamed protein product [Bursaphelenchus xylophilus]|uniref:Galactosylgalactosylxylosylprotein 3-beta-glucuronosyltransferase n=1 Tax=Bursaphelenchus xylophilus TaxID=6326 RepID=A0A1I7RQB9_BURXY|nr:unnamed protein product [Bursaphelenchus xylophilus]CAG9104324.1 unnamed protein product [Bursaphelenchus xylophilus]